MIFGYARVSTGDQNPASQEDVLARAGVEKLYVDRCSGAIAPAARPEFARLLEVLRHGDEVVVHALDRLGRNASAVLLVIEKLEQRGVALRVLRDGISTTGPTGKLVVQLLAAVGELERSHLRERSRLGQESARNRGVHMGRPSSLTAAQKAHAIQLRRSGMSLTQIGGVLGVSKATVLRATRGYDAG